MHERICLRRSSVIPETAVENLVQKRQPPNYSKEHTWMDGMNLNLWHCPQMDTANGPTGVNVKVPKTGSLIVLPGCLCCFSGYEMETTAFAYLL